MLKVAAGTFEILPQPGSEGRTLLGNRASQIFSPLKSSVVLLEADGKRVVLLTSHFLTHYYRVSNILRNAVGKALSIPRESVLCFSSHNHCVVKLIKTQYAMGCDDADLLLPESELTWEGEQLLKGYVDLAVKLKGELTEVTIRHGRGHERRITHNRKGRRADGTAFLMREEDRLQYGGDFNGDIDDDAFVVGFFDRQERPVAMLTQFTGHPVTAFHCDFPVVHGEFPQVACDELSAAFGGIPVAFLQGCAGDTNSKGLLAATPAQVNVKNAEKYGRQLGETFLAIAGKLQPSRRHDLSLLWRTVELPFRGVPARDDLEKRLRLAEGFLERCAAGDDAGTRFCDGLNTPSNMSIPYRAALIKPVRDWLQWALSFHLENRLHEAPTRVAFRVAALRIGDVGVIGMPCEPLLGIGRQIKAASPLPMTIPCGYMNDTNYAYVPDSPNCDDLDYVSAFYRYTKTMLPYQKPAGDLLASAAVKMLEQTLAP